LFGRWRRGLRALLGRLLRFRLSTLLLLITIAAVLLAWRRDRAVMQARIDKLLSPDPHWGVAETIGPPDTQGFGDITTAWASKTPDDQPEWLELEYAQAVTPQAIWIYETFNPGAVVKVCSVGMLGFETVLWEGKDPTPAGTPGGISKISLRTRVAVDRVKIYFDSPAVPGWNEVDAVGLVYGKNQIEWAQSARASSSYNEITRGQGQILFSR
jgi:hypothetical protein